MENHKNIKEKNKNNLSNPSNNNQNNANFNQFQSNFPFNINDINLFQLSNNNQFMNSQPFFINKDFYNPQIYNNKIFNDNNKDINNNKNENIQTPIEQNNYFNNSYQIQEIDKKINNNQKRFNYIPKNLISNPYQNTNLFNNNNNNQNSFSNMQSNYENNFLNPNYLNEIHTNNNYNQDNEIDKNIENIVKEINIDKNNINKDIKNKKKCGIYSYTFHFDKEDVASALTSEEFYKNYCPHDIIDNVVFPKDIYNKNEPIIISVRWKKFYKVKLISSNQVNSEECIKFSLKIIETDPFDIGSFEMDFKYYYDTSENNTIFIIEYKLDQNILSEAFFEEFTTLDMDEVCKNAENYLNQRKKEKTHISSVILNAPKEIAWNCITKLSKKKDINYMHKYNLSYIRKEDIKIKNNNDIKEENNKEEYLQKGDTIIIKKKENEIFAELIITDIKKEKDINEIIIICNKPENKSKGENSNNDNEIIEIINQKIVLSVRKIIEDMCFFEYKHIWNNPVNIDREKTLDFLKNKSISILKENIEKANINKNEKNENNDDNSLINIFNLLCPMGF